MEEKVVSKKVAELLKEKGFNEFCKYFYEKGSSIKKRIGNFRYNNTDYVNTNLDCVAPTQSFAQQWLREEKQIAIGITPKFEKSTGQYLYKFELLSKEYHCVSVYFYNYEEALEEALKTALKL